MIMSKIYFLSCTFMLLGVIMAAPADSDLSEMDENEVPPYGFNLITREQWKARAPKEVTPLKAPVPYVTIHHSYIPAACYNVEEGIKAMKSMQNMHMDTNNWWDIGYSFAVGSDGTAYEGRGWKTLGAHAKYFNSVSIGICLIGDWRTTVPPPVQLKTAQALISLGVEQGFIRPDYRLVGHRQVRATECPGQALYDEIRTWHHYSNFPATPIDLLDIPEIPESSKNEIRNQTKAVHIKVTNV